MLNEHQTLAVKHMNGPCLTLAGPGSGKTTVLVERIINLIESGISPKSILVITFTKDAAIEMKSRFERKIFPNVYPVTFGTFHSVFFHILQSSSDFKSFSIMDNKEKRMILNDSIRNQNVNIDSEEILEILEREISKYVNNDFSLNENYSVVVSNNIFIKVYNEYCKRKNLHHLLDFDDMLLKAKELLSSDTEILTKWQNTYKYYLIDEFQDINSLQLHVLKLLCVDNNIFCVGDDDQAIYGFRGSTPKYMIDFPSIFPKTKIIELDTNYRSARNIVIGSKKLISYNKNRYDKEYIAKSNDDGSIILKKFIDEIHEAKWIVEDIIDTINASPQKSIAILYRNHDQSNNIINIFNDNDISYISKSSHNVKKLIFSKSFISLIKLSIDIVSNNLKSSDLINYINENKLNIIRAGIEGEYTNPDKWLSFYNTGSVGFNLIEDFLCKLRIMSRLSLKSQALYITNNFKIKTSLNDSCMKVIDEYKSKKDFLNSLEHINSKPEQNNNCNSNIFLYTFHGSKGLEFDKVYILDVVSQITPSKNATEIEALEEERRMMYVAMTRAKEELVICTTEKYKNNNVIPSLFIEEIFE